MLYNAAPSGDVAYVSGYVDSNIKKRLVSLAERNNRSASAELRRALDLFLQAEDADQPVHAATN